jgi:hypothetical protein
MKWDVIKLLIFVAVVICISYVLAPRGGDKSANSFKRAFTFELGAFFDDIRIAWNIIASNKWLFVLPLAFCLLEEVISTTLRAMFMPGGSQEMIESYKSNSAFVDSNIIISILETQTNKYIYYIQESITSSYLALTMLPLLIFRRKFALWINQKAGTDVWQPFGRYLIVTFFMSLATAPLLYYQYFAYDKIQWSQQLSNLFSFLSNFFSQPFEYAIASFFGCGMIYSIATLSNGGAITSKDFLQGAGKFFKRAFWANWIIGFFWLLLSQPFMAIPYIDAGGANTAFYIGSVLTPVGLLFMAVPFLIVCYDYNIIKALGNSISLTLRNAGRFLPIFLLGGISLSILPILATRFVGVLMPTVALDKVILLHIVTFNVFIATVIAIVFYRTLVRAMDDLR